MSEILDRVVRTREAAHEAARLAYANAQAILDNGKPVHITCQEYEQDRSLRQNRYYWGACIREISEQATIEGQRWSGEAWHELFRRMFLGYEIEKVRVAGRKRAVINRRLKSTAKLKVKAFNLYLEKVQAFAASDLGVHFSVLDWQEWSQ
jgi:hypothetical protein